MMTASYDCNDDNNNKHNNNNNNNKHNNNNNDNKQQQQQQEKGKTELTNRTSRQTVQIYLKSLGNRAQHDREYRSVESEQSNQHSLSCLHTKHKNTLSQTDAQTERHSQTTGHLFFGLLLSIILYYAPTILGGALSDDAV